MRIPITASTFNPNEPDLKALAEKHNLEFSVNPFGRRLSEAETIAHIRDAPAVLAGLETLGVSVFAACPNLKIISRIGVGIDNIDLSAAASYGIEVCNTPDAPTDSVAEMALAGLLACVRGISRHNGNMRKHIWEKKVERSVFGAAVLFVGYGRIAKRFEQLLQPFNIKPLIYDPFVTGENVDILELISNADIISLHASGKEVILGAREISAVKQGTVILNTARGSLVDEAAIAGLLKSDCSACYFSDVFSEEPYAGELCDLPNAVLTPHLASSTDICRNQMEYEAVENMLVRLKNLKG